MKTLHDYKYFKVVKKDYEKASMTGLWVEGKNVAVLPYYLNEQGKIDKFGVINECNPLKENNFFVTAVTGGVEENETTLFGAKRELLEETGLNVENDDRWIYLGDLTTSKQTNEKHQCFAVNVTDIAKSNAKGDGSENEKLSEYQIVKIENVNEIDDCFINSLVLKLCWQFIKKDLK